MSPILTSVLLGLTAAAANVFGGAIIVQKNWERSYLRYFVALGAGFMLAVAMVEMVPESIELRGPRAGFLILLGYLLVHFFEHTVTPHFHFGEETHADEFVHTHKGYSVLMGLLIHTFFDGIAIASGFIVSELAGMGHLHRRLPAQNSGGIHDCLGHAGQRPQPQLRLVNLRDAGRRDRSGRDDDGHLSSRGRIRIAAVGRRDDLRGRVGFDSRSK